MRLGVDSFDYYVLDEAASLVKNTPGILMEIGVREGGGLQYIIDGLLNNHIYGRTVVGLDPYGDLPYEWKEGKIAPWTYSNDMKKTAYKNLFEYVIGKPVNLELITMTDETYFKRYADGVPIYETTEEILEDRYALIHYDGPHSLDALKKEMAFFRPRTPIGGIWVFDDVTDFYDHDAVHKVLTETCFEEITKTQKKASYRRFK